MPPHSAVSHRILLGLLLALAIFFTPFTVQASETLIDPWASHWKYLDDGSDQGTAWRRGDFDDSSWKTGLASLGYGYGDEATVINSGPVDAHYTTSYYRQTFNAIDPARYIDIGLLLLRDDGVVVYINNTEVFRSNMPSGTVRYDTPASSEISVATSVEAVVSATLKKGVLRRGENTIAVELHQANASSSRAVFALKLDGNTVPNSVGIFSRGPYLQMVTTDSAVIRWGTTGKTSSVVRFGTDPAILDRRAKKSKRTYYHEVKLKNLSPATTYYYSVGSRKEVFSAGPDQFFKTQPPVGTSTPTRIWVIGDSGRNNQNQRDTYQAYLDYTGTAYTDLWLLLGDNAYGNGTDQEYQNGFFEIYPQLLRQTVVWPSLGNHDGHSVNTPTQSGVYYSIFSLPTKGEAGGVPSRTEAYYSYNYGNIHFVVLDAYDVDRSPGGAMAQWLEADLTANKADWVIAYWHHPPYSKGSHNSDTEIELIEMRENILPILEQHGTDLVLCGHSHNYERSKFVQGHYGFSNTYTDGLFALDAGSGNISLGAQAYSKAHPAVAHGGTVYAVVGTAAEASGGTLDHPVMSTSFNKLGSMVIDIDNLTLSARFIDEHSVVQDAFTLQKIPGPARIAGIENP